MPQKAQTTIFNLHFRNGPNYDFGEDINAQQQRQENKGRYQPGGTDALFFQDVYVSTFKKSCPTISENLKRHWYSKPNQRKLKFNINAHGGENDTAFHMKNSKGKWRAYSAKLTVKFLMDNGLKRGDYQGKLRIALYVCFGSNQINGDSSMTEMRDELNRCGITGFRIHGTGYVTEIDDQGQLCTSGDEWRAYEVFGLQMPFGRQVDVDHGSWNASGNRETVVG